MYIVLHYCNKLVKTAFLQTRSPIDSEATPYPGL